MNVLSKSMALILPADRIQALKVLALVAGVALLEAAGVVSIMPFLSVLGDSE